MTTETGTALTPSSRGRRSAPSSRGPRYRWIPGDARFWSSATREGRPPPRSGARSSNTWRGSGISASAAGRRQPWSAVRFSGTGTSFSPSWPGRAMRNSAAVVTALRTITDLVSRHPADFTRPLLALEDYLSLGRKRAPNFRHDRSAVHAVAVFYQERLERSGRWDEIDLARAALRRLEGSAIEPLWDLVVCDEVQDLADVQIALLFRLAADPRSVVLTGDPRQIINPDGISMGGSEVPLQGAGPRGSRGPAAQPQFPVRWPDRSPGQRAAGSQGLACRTGGHRDARGVEVRRPPSCRARGRGRGGAPLQAGRAGRGPGHSHPPCRRGPAAAKASGNRAGLHHRRGKGAGVRHRAAVAICRCRGRGSGLARHCVRRRGR